MDNRKDVFIIRAEPCIKNSTNADRIQGKSDEALLKFIAAVFTAGMAAEERGHGATRLHQGE